MKFFLHNKVPNENKVDYLLTRYIGSKLDVASIQLNKAMLKSYAHFLFLSEYYCLFVLLFPPFRL